IAALLVSGISLAAFALSGAPPSAKDFVVLAVEYKGTFGANESQPEGTVVKAYRWDPSYIEVNRGDTVTLRIFGVNGASHPTTIDAFGQSFTVSRGRWTNVTFVADKAVLADMVCHVPDHTETMHLLINVLG
ncbi:MAG: hypothetical protein ACT4OI_10925, partial [Methanobacteriota archaeon]